MKSIVLVIRSYSVVSQVINLESARIDVVQTSDDHTQSGASET